METCAYCGQTLRLVAGFCATCQAPASVAQRARLVAEPEAQNKRAKSAAPLLPIAPVARPSAIGTRLLLAGGLLALGLVFVLISVRLNANPIHIFIPPPEGSLTVSQQAGETASASVTVGQPFTLRYDVQVEARQADVSLTIIPQHGAARTVEEWWPHGHDQRMQTLVPLAPDLWQIVLRKDGRIIQAETIQIVNASAS